MSAPPNRPDLLTAELLMASRARRRSRARRSTVTVTAGHALSAPSSAPGRAAGEPERASRLWPSVESEPGSESDPETAAAALAGPQSGAP